MKEMIAALDRALLGDQDALQGFGVEQNLFVRAGWEDTLSVDGAGQTTYFTHGSDRLGDSVGLYRTQLSAAEVRPVLLGARAIAQAALKPARAEAYDTRITISLVAGGRHLRFTTAVQPESLQQLDSLTQPLQRALMKAVQHPVRTLAISVTAPEGLVRGAPALFVLKLHHGGTEGMWVPNPAVLANQKEGERVAITWVALTPPTPGVTPVPAVPQRSMLSPQQTDGAQPEYLWLAPKSEIEVSLRATLEVPSDLKQLVFGAELVVNQGEERLAGRPCFRGSLLSADGFGSPR